MTLELATNGMIPLEILVQIRITTYHAVIYYYIYNI